MPLRQRFNFGMVFLLILAGLYITFLTAPLDLFGFAPIVIEFQRQSRLTLEALSPYLMVAALGAGVGLAELSSTFSDYPREAIITQWGQLMVWLNGAAAVLAFLIARVYAPPETSPVVLIIAVGLGFPALIRTKFTLAKQFGGEGSGDLSLNIGWLYEQFQNLCKKQIDMELMNSRLEQVERLLSNYSTPQLYVIARYTVRARATLTEQEEKARLDELEKIIVDAQGGPQTTKMNLALLILELGGKAYVDRLVMTPSEASNASSAPNLPASAPKEATVAQTVTPLLNDTTPDTSTEAVAKRLTQLPLNDLTELAKEVLKAPEDIAYVERAASAKSTLGEIKQKAPIAYYIISKTSAEAAVQALEKRQAAQQ